MTGYEITLLRPLWLLALPCVLALGWWLYVRRGGIGDWGRAAQPQLLAALTALGRVDGASSRIPMMSTVAVAAITIIALSGPAIERRDTLSFRNLDGVVFVVDASASVTGSPGWTQMQTMGRFALTALGTRPAALVVYGGDAYVATDMTADLLQLGQTFLLIDGETVPDPGSRPERGLALALRLLDEAGVIAGDVVLFTDGGGLGPASLQEAGQIAARGARLSVVSPEPSSGIDSHAAVGGGHIFSLAETDRLGDWLREDARTRLEQQDYPLLFWKDFGRYLLFLALFPLLLLFRRQIA